MDKLEMNGDTNGQSRSGWQSRFQLGAISPSKYFFGIAFILGLLFAFISNAEDERLPWYLIMLQWQLQTLLPISLIITSHMLMGHWRSFERMNPWLQLILSGWVGVLVFTPIALLIDWTLLDEYQPQVPIIQQLWDELTGVAPPVMITWVVINMPWVLGFRIQQLPATTNHEHSESAADTATSQEAPDFMTHLPSEIRSEVISLKSELHYIEVRTLKGQGLVLYNLKDAIAELPNDSGIQTHRSHWVSFSQIKKLIKRGREGVLLTAVDERIPVSRYRLQAVIDACAKRGIELN